ncbi:MAG: alcohol dehydrogenase catalytic domain-containing protein [Phycisphaerales bacterium]
MRAIVGGPHGPRFDERPDRTPAPGECVVRVRSALTLRTDLEGAHRSAPSTVALGEAFVGVVDVMHADAMGDRAKDARAWIGRRVAVDPVVRCGRCERCLAGLGAHCVERALLGRDRDGGLAERVTVPIANLVALPDGLDDERAVFAVPVARAIEATRHVRVEGKTYITVLGDGVEALVATQVMTRLNASVRIVATDAETMAVAERLGVKHRLASEVGRRGDQHVVVDFTGVAESFAVAVQLARPRGTVVLMRDIAGADLTPVARNELRVQGCGHGPLPQAIDLLTQRAIEVVGLVTKRVAFAHAIDALNESRDGVLVRCATA